MSNEQSLILIVDDDPGVLETLKDLFQEHYRILTADNGRTSVDLAKDNPDIAAVIMDIKMPGMDGITAARLIREARPTVPIIVHTAYAGEYGESEIDDNEKPFDFIQKGKSIPQLLRSVRNAVDAFNLRNDSRALTAIAEEQFKMFGRSRSMQQVFRTIHRVAPSDAKVMILGESGTGKELVAKAIRACSTRRDKRMATFSCSHKSPYMIEAELFGNVRGAYTGATYDRMGLFEYADGGTVFLDEIGDLDINTQGKLLQVIESGEYVKLGSPEVRQTDIRLLCATNHNLERLVEDGKFRQDLYFRLKGIQIFLPPLRDRREDIPLLVEKFAERYIMRNGQSPKVFDRSAIESMLEFDWPGNVRQLRDTVESLIVLTASDIIFSEDVCQVLEMTPLISRDAPKKLSERLREIERTLIIGALVESQYNISGAARLLDVDRANLQKKIKFHDIDIRSYREK